MGIIWINNNVKATKRPGSVNNKKVMIYEISFKESNAAMWPLSVIINLVNHNNNDFVTVMKLLCPELYVRT